jgi:hypothetical protein
MHQISFLVSEMAREKNLRLAKLSFNGDFDFGQLFLSVSGWLLKVHIHERTFAFCTTYTIYQVYGVSTATSVSTVQGKFTSNLYVTCSTEPGGLHDGFVQICTFVEMDRKLGRNSPNS